LYEQYKTHTHTYFFRKTVKFFWGKTGGACSGLRFEELITGGAFNGLFFEELITGLTKAHVS
jgi:hypothetical protein